MLLSNKVKQTKVCFFSNKALNDMPLTQLK